MKLAYVYMLASTSRTLYTGVTSDLERRVWEHKTQLHEGFTKRYHVTRLVWFAEFSRMDDAIAFEKALKGKSRAKKRGDQSALERSGVGLVRAGGGIQHWRGRHHLSSGFAGRFFAAL